MLPLPSSEVTALRGRLWTNSGAQLAGAIIARVSRAGAILTAARLLGPEGFGIVATGLAGYEMLRVLGEQATTKSAGDSGRLRLVGNPAPASDSAEGETSS